MGERRAHVGRIVTGRVAFVTGGSRGIGRATCVALAAAGHRVAFCFGSDDAGAADTEAAVRSTGGEVLAIRASVGDAAAIDAAFSTVEGSFGPVELLVNNAGITRDEIGRAHV